MITLINISIDIFVCYYGRTPTQIQTDSAGIQTQVSHSLVHGYIPEPRKTVTPVLVLITLYTARPTTEYHIHLLNV